ncbi:MAG TPA: hypothetical protein PLS49_04605, partial [Candidatus Woesebacteria bacterium]|nr:hypothetical protein [Candidatus Woesebacteria bacterium]
SWEEAKDFYLQARNDREFPEQVVFQLQADNTNYRFMRVNEFGTTLHLSDKPTEIPEAIKKSLHFDTRNIPDKESAHTYYKTLEMPNWQSQVFDFVTSFGKTAEGQDILTKLGIKDLRLLTPQQATKLTLELVTRMKKYNIDEIGLGHGNTYSDQNSALVLLHRGLRERDSKDFKGNGVCRNFASTVKIVFDGIKAKQTQFNYLQNTYAFYDIGTGLDYDPIAEDTNSLLRHINQTYKNSTGHAWNSFVTIESSGMSQTVVDATWADIDYDTQELVNLDYTLQRIEKDVYRNMNTKDTNTDINQAVNFYTFLIDTLPTHVGLVLNPETLVKIKESELYNSILNQFNSTYPQLSAEQKENFSLNSYKKLVDRHRLESKTQFYLDRCMETLQGKEQLVSPSLGTELIRLFVHSKKSISNKQLTSLFALPTENKEDRNLCVQKYIKAWEATDIKYRHINDLFFFNPDIQQMILQNCSPELQKKLESELRKRKEVAERREKQNLQN